jgi:hypothetical protein
MSKSRIATAIFALIVFITAGWIMYTRYVAIGAAEHQAEGEEIAAFISERAIPFVNSGALTSTNEDQRNAAFGAFFDQIQSPSLFRLKAWTNDYRVLWSDLPEIIGTKHSENVAVEEAYQGNVNLSVGQPKLEHVSERQVVQLLEVYTPVKDASGTVVLVVETYNVGKPLSDDAATRLVIELAGLLVGAVLLVMLGRLAFRRVFR